jgi:hypothetical protein
MDPEKFINEFVEGKTIIKIQDSEFELKMEVREKLSVLSLYSLLYKNINSETTTFGDKAINGVKTTLNDVFTRSYPNVPKEKMVLFVNNYFLEILSGIAIASGWINETK